MGFSSALFLFCFLPLTLTGYYLIRKELRSIFLLGTSLVFFGWTVPKTLPILGMVILISYIGALLLERFETNLKAKRTVLFLGIAAVTGFLIYFKYTNFLIDIANTLFPLGWTERNLIVPIGISFFCFQSISYLADVYMGRVAACQNIIEISLYFAMFPKLTQGPIMRYEAMEKELKSADVSFENISDGVERFIVGLTKKLMIADVLGSVADGIFVLPPEGLSAALAWGGSIAYFFQIYFDFSGYSDMAIGLGKMFGFHFIENFNYPYISTSITEFWRRWHISLSSWFRNYIYIPLGGNRRGNQYAHIAVVFLLTGIWHGAAWTFIIWGVMHGIVNMLEKYLMSTGIYQKIPCAIRYVFTMMVVLLGWMIFRSPDLTSAVAFAKAMFGLGNATAVQYRLGWFYNTRVTLITGIAIAASLPWKQWFPKATAFFRDVPTGMLLKTVILAVMMGVCVVLAMTSTYTSFIYFQF